MRTEGNCGRSARWYGDELETLRGVLTDEDLEDLEHDAGVPDPYIPPVQRCEHGELVDDNFNCATCAWQYGWEKSEH